MYKREAVLFIVVIAGFLAPQPEPAQAQAEQIVGSVATGIAIDEAINKIQGIIDDATEHGNYLLVRAGIEARIAIENFRLANSELLDKAFSELDQASRDNFARIDRTLQDTINGTLSATEAALKISESAQQLSVIVDPQGFRSYLLRYNPSIVFDGKPSPILLSVRGVNLDEAETIMTTPTGKISPQIRGKQELLFQVPTSAFSFQPEHSTLANFKLQYQSVKPGWFNRLFGIKETVNRDIVFLSLPKQLATYTYSTVVGGSKRVVDPKEYWLDQFKGVDADQDRAIAPPPGWKIDLSTLNHSQGHGEGNSYCIGFSPQNKTEFGVTFRAHVGRIKNLKYPSGAPGYVNCRVTYTLYKDDPIDVAGPSGTGSVGWTADQIISLPENLKTLTLDVKTFDGIQRSHSGDGSGSYYKLYKEPTRLLIKPQVPTDLTS